jgi:hypothetical protein
MGVSVLGRLAEGASGVQGVDDSVAPALLLQCIVHLGSDIVGAWTERSEVRKQLFAAAMSSRSR